MSTVNGGPFQLPPVVECISQERCLGFGKKVYSANKICLECLKRYDPQHLRALCNENAEALALIDEEILRKEATKDTLESRGRYLCAFEDPTYQHCRWRRNDLNLRGTRTSCNIVTRKGMACTKCWNRHLEKVAIIQYFTATGMCHEEADKIAQQAGSSKSVGGNNREDDDDVEGYNLNSC